MNPEIKMDIKTVEPITLKIIVNVSELFDSDAFISTVCSPFDLFSLESLVPLVVVSSLC